MASSLLLGAPGHLTRWLWHAALEPDPPIERVRRARSLARRLDLQVACGFVSAAIVAPDQLAQVPLDRPEDAVWRGRGTLGEGPELLVERAGEDRAWVWDREQHAARRGSEPIVYDRSTHAGGLEVCVSLPGQPLVYASLARIERSEGARNLAFFGAVAITPLTLVLDLVLLPITVTYIIILGYGFPRR